MAAQHASRVSANRELPLRLALAVPLWTLKGFTNPEVEASYSRALELCHGSEDDVQMAQILSGIGGLSFFRPRIPDALEMTDRMLRLAETSQDPAVRTWSPLVSSMTVGQAGDVVAARVHVEKCLHTYNPGQHRTLSRRS